MQLQRADAVCSLLLLQSKGLPVNTVVDIGSAEGSFFLIRGEVGIYPDARHFFIDAMEENAPLYERVARSFPASHTIAAVANLDGETEIRVDPGAYNTHIQGLQPDQERYTRRVLPVRTLDRLIRERPEVAGPYLLKIDVQGGELDVLRGAEQTLAEASMIVLEAQICLFRDTLPDIVQFLQVRGFALYDITNLSYYQSDGTLYQCLAVFIARRFDFRKMNPWGDPEKERAVREQLADRRRHIRASVEAVCAKAEAQQGMVVVKVA